MRAQPHVLNKYLINKSHGTNGLLLNWSSKVTSIDSKKQFLSLLSKSQWWRFFFFLLHTFLYNYASLIMGAHYNPKMFFILQSNTYYQIVRALISFPQLMNEESLRWEGRKLFWSLMRCYFPWELKATVQSDRPLSWSRIENESFCNLCCYLLLLAERNTVFSDMLVNPFCGLINYFVTFRSYLIKFSVAH